MSSAKSTGLSGEQIIKLSKFNKSKKGKAARAAAERKRMSEWADFLRDDGDFDYEYILRVLAYKLRRTREHIVSHGFVADADRTGGEIKAVEDLIGLVLDEEGYRKRIVDPVASDSANDFSKMKAAYRKADRTRREDLKKALALMAKNIFDWWD